MIEQRIPARLAGNGRQRRQRWQTFGLQLCSALLGLTRSIGGLACRCRVIHSRLSHRLSPPFFSPSRDTLKRHVTLVVLVALAVFGSAKLASNGLPLLRTPKAMCSNFRIAAPKINILLLPLAQSRKPKARISGLKRNAVIAGKYNPFRKREEPALDKRERPRTEVPDWRMRRQRAPASFKIFRMARPFTGSVHCAAQTSGVWFRSLRLFTSAPCASSVFTTSMWPHEAA